MAMYVRYRNSHLRQQSSQNRVNSLLVNRLQQVHCCLPRRRMTPLVPLTAIVGKRCRLPTRLRLSSIDHRRRFAPARPILDCPHRAGLHFFYQLHLLH